MVCRGVADFEERSDDKLHCRSVEGKPVTLTCIAGGISADGGLESADELTLSAALSGRTKL